MKIVPFLVLAFFILFACNGGDDDPTEGKFVEKTIIASVGGTLTTSESVELYIPPDALPVDGKVLLGRTGDEPTSVPNKNLQIVGNPITLRLPSRTILKPLQLSIPLTSISIDTVNNCIMLFNGSTYFPIAFSINGRTAIVSIDTIDWESTGAKGEPNSETFIITLQQAQSIPLNQMGLKKVTINSTTKEMEFYSQTACPSSRILILIHGLAGNPTGWKEFLTKIMSENDSPYTEYWTFGYNSAASINHNGEQLYDNLQTYANGAQIDIVAHSMGGLVSRSMIEKYNGAPFIHRLFTLGTPHEGSPLAVIRYFFGAMVAIDNPFLISTYNYNTQGLKDLNISSNFISQMRNKPGSSVRYYTTAAINNPDENKITKYTSKIIYGDDDGIVSVSSAHGVDAATPSGPDIYIPVGLAHIEMTSNNEIFKQVFQILKVSKDSIKDIDNNYYKIGQIGSQTWMLKNLKTTRYSNGDPIGTTIPATLDIFGEAIPKYQWSYGGNESNVVTYGRLYTWYAVTDSRGVCPTGWHVPTDGEWGALTDYLTFFGYGYECSGGDIAKSMASKKLFMTCAEPGTIGNDMASNNNSGFSALPGGRRNGDGLFNSIRYYGYWWSVTENNDSTAWTRYMGCNSGSVNSYDAEKEAGWSVRCIKDN